MTKISASLVKELREKTGAGMMDCKRALEESDADLEKAMTYLRVKGLAAAEKKAGRAASEGIVDAYIHMGGRIGVLIEVNCETDFVARTEEFRSLVHDLAMQVAAANPRYVRRDDIPAADLEKEREILTRQAATQGKPPAIVDKIVQGRLEKFFKEVVLEEQPFIRDTDISIGELVKMKIGEIGENIVIRRFARFEVGADADSAGASVD